MADSEKEQFPEERLRQFAAQLAELDQSIVEISAVREPSAIDTDQLKNLDLICSFDPEPDSDIVGFFWIANLLTRIEFEELDERLAFPFEYSLALKIGEQVFLPNGETLNKTQGTTVLWQAHEE